MSILGQFKNLSEASKARAVEKLITESTPDFDFFLFIVLSFLMATLGLLIGSTAVIIGSMLIAPILYPVLSFSLGMVMSDFKLMGRSFKTLVQSVLVGLGVAAVTALFFMQESALSTELLARTEPSLLYFAVALISGIAVSYSLVGENLSEMLPGIAVSVALLPPLAAVGIGLTLLQWMIIKGAFLLFLLNLLGIIFASMVSFSLMNLYVKRNVAKTTIEKEEKRVEQEAKQAEEKEAREEE